MNTNNYLAKFKNNYTSQCGEDGMIEAIFRMLKIYTGDVIDIGASDGEWNSNTYTLLNRGFRVYAIEASNNAKKLKTLSLTYPNLHSIQARIEKNIDSSTHINKVLDSMDTPKQVDFINIDIDSIDAWVFKDINRDAKLVVIEIEPRYYPLDDIWHNPEGNRETNPPQNLTGFYPIYKIAKNKGYHLIGQASQNLFFLKKELLPHLNCPEITEVHELTNFDPKYLSLVDKTRWKRFEPPQEESKI